MDFEIKSELMIIIILHDINSLLIDSKMEIETRKKKKALFNRNAAYQNTFRISFWKILLLLESFVFCLQVTGSAEDYPCLSFRVFSAFG